MNIRSTYFSFLFRAVISYKRVFHENANKQIFLPIRNMLCTLIFVQLSEISTYRTGQYKPHTFACYENLHKKLLGRSLGDKFYDWNN